MSANGYRKFGDNNYVFGFEGTEVATIVTATGIQPQTLSIQGEPEFEAEGKNATGMTVAYAVGDEKYTFTLSGYLVDDETLNAADIFNFDGKTFIITSRKRDVANTDFQKAELSGKCYPLINVKATP